ncbi:MAG: hypothetical protein CMC70_08915 [Flavobacteriaceae bacterium]|nr:hypothetical protein [Flavobacteriaceae bacterium]
MKAPFISFFLKAPELKLSLKDFPFAAFSTSEIDAESLLIDFPSEQMLGKQAEFLFEQGLKHTPRFQIIAANIQIQGATETLGELDYLVFDSKTQQTLHIELACKFYLLDESLGTALLDQWIGPNRKDRLQDKLGKMKTRQFPLLHRDETAWALNNFSVKTPVIQQQYCFKAFLFVPKGFQQTKLPQHFQNCLVGYYMYWEQLIAEKDETALYALPQKKQWLLPAENLMHWLSFSEAKEEIKKFITEKRSPLVYKKKNGLVEKFFVVWWD